MDGLLRIDWQGNDWQDHVCHLLRLRCGTGGFQQVPDEHRGDCGIEGFSPKDGCCYQCYAPREPLSPSKRYEAHRKKITDDIGKFINNRAKFVRLLAATKIGRWLLVVPKHDSKETVAHCQKKTLEVRAANLPYATKDIYVSIVDQREFELERRNLMEAGIAKLVLPVETARTIPSLDADLLAKLDVKIQKLVPARQRADIRRQLLQKYADGRRFMQRLRRELRNHLRRGRQQEASTRTQP